jgi:hypothetical protein
MLHGEQDRQYLVPGPSESGPETTSGQPLFCSKQCGPLSVRDRASAVKRNAFDPSPVAPLLQTRVKLILAESIENLVFRHSARAGHLDAPVCEIELARGMGIGADALRQPSFIAVSCQRQSANFTHDTCRLVATPQGGWGPPEPEFSLGGVGRFRSSARKLVPQIALGRAGH